MKNTIEKARCECYKNYKDNNTTSLQVAKCIYKNSVVKIEFLRLSNNLESFKAFQILQNRKFLLISISNSNLFDCTRLYKMVTDCLNGNIYK